MNIIDHKPEWGVSLNRGWIGFITRDYSALADGIEWFERYEDGLPFVHAFVVTGPDELVEAYLPRVRRAPVSQYIGRHNVQCFIRVPAGWTPAMGEEIAAEAGRWVGRRYAVGVIIADALANSFLGHWLNRLLWHLPDRLMRLWLDRPLETVCSELAAICLRADFALRLRGCLKRDPATVTPKDLGNDWRAFQPGIFRIA